MALYRTYLYTRKTFNAPPIDCEFATDLDALNWAKHQALEGEFADVWQGTRFLQRVGEAVHKLNARGA